MVSAKVPKAICACAIARKNQRVPCTPQSSQGVQASHIPCAWPGRAACCASLSLLLLASPGLAVRGEPVQRDEGPLDLRLDPLHPFRASSSPTSLSSRRFPALLERPAFAIRGEPARRGGDSLDRRLLSGSPLGVRLGERRQEKPRHFVLALRSHSSLRLEQGDPHPSPPPQGEGIQVIVLSLDTSRLTELTPSLLVTCHLHLKSLVTPHTSRLADL